MEDLVAVTVNGVYKDFLLPQERVNSIKGILTGLTKGSPWRIKKTQHALKDISFEVKQGEFFGIVGRNGSGKSTLLKMLAGIYQPSQGIIQVQGKLVPFIELGVGFNMELTGRENVYLNGALLGFSKTEMDAQYDDIVEFAEIRRFMDQKLKNYSSGMQVRLAFSLAIRAQADVLLFDEVLAVGDADFQRKCFNHFRELKKEKKTVIFVSHDMSAIREYCDRALLIDKSKLIIMDSANEVSKEYSRMFIESSASGQGAKQGTKKVNRWGIGKMSYTKLAANPPILSSQKFLEIVCEAKAEEDLDEVLFGFIIKDTSGNNLLGTNSQIERQKITNIKKNQVYKVTWKVPNVFADGKYTFDPSIVLYDGEVCDWWEDAVKIEVRKEDHAPYLIAPDIGLTISTETNDLSG